MPRGTLTFNIEGRQYVADWDSPNSPTMKDLDEIEAGIRAHYGLRKRVLPMPNPLSGDGFEPYLPLHDPNANIERKPLWRKAEKLSDGSTQIVEAYPDPKKVSPAYPSPAPQQDWLQKVKSSMVTVPDGKAGQNMLRRIDSYAASLPPHDSWGKAKIALSPEAKQHSVLSRLGVNAESLSQAIDLGLSVIRKNDGSYIPKAFVLNELAKAGAAPVLGSRTPDESAERFAATAGGSKPMPQTAAANTVMGDGKAFTYGRRKIGAAVEKTGAAVGAILSPQFEASMQQAVDEGSITPDQKRLVMSQIANASIPLGGGLGGVMLGKAFPAFNAANMAAGNLFGGMAAAALADPNAVPEEKYGALLQFAMIAGIPTIIHAFGKTVTAHELAPEIRQTMREFGVTKSEAKSLIGAIKTGEPRTVARVVADLMPDAQLRINAKIRDWLSEPAGMHIVERSTLGSDGIEEKRSIGSNDELVPMGDASWREATTGKSDLYEGPMQIVRKYRLPTEAEAGTGRSGESVEPRIGVSEDNVKSSRETTPTEAEAGTGRSGESVEPRIGVSEDESNPFYNAVDTRKTLLKLDSRDPRLDSFADEFDEKLHDAVLKAFGEDGDVSAFQALERAQEEASYSNDAIDAGSRAYEAWDTYGELLYEAMKPGRTGRARVFRYDKRQPLGRRWIPMGWAKTIMASDLPPHIREALDLFADRWNNEAGYMSEKYASSYIQAQKMGGDYNGPKPLRASEWQLQDQEGKAQEYLVSMVRDFLESINSPTNPKQLKRILREEAQAESLTEQELKDAVEYWTRRPDSEIADRSGSAGENQADAGRRADAEFEQSTRDMREGDAEVFARNSREHGQKQTTVEWDGQKVFLSDPDLIAEYDAINNGYEAKRKYLEILLQTANDLSEQRNVSVQLEKLKRSHDEDLEDFFLGVRRRDRIAAGIEPDLDAEFLATIGTAEPPSPEAVAQAKRILAGSSNSVQLPGPTGAIPSLPIVSKAFKGWRISSTPDGLVLDHGRSGLKLAIVGMPEIQPEPGTSLNQGRFVAGAAWLTNGTDYMPVNAMIALAEGGRPTTVYHEAFHIMEKLGLFDGREWNAMLRDFGKVGDNSDPVENVADAYEKWLSERAPGTGAFSRIKRFFGDLLQAAVNHQQWKKEQTFRKMESGNVWNRVSRDPQTGRRLSIGPPPSTSETLRTDALLSANDPIRGQNTPEINGGMGLADAAAPKRSSESKSYSTQDTLIDSLRERLKAYAVLGEHLKHQGFTGRAWKEALVKEAGAGVKPYLDALWHRTFARSANTTASIDASGAHLATGKRPEKPGRGILRTLEHLFFTTDEAAEHATKMLESVLGAGKLEGSAKDLGNAINIQSRIGWKVETRVVEGIRNRSGDLVTKGLPEIQKMLNDAGIDLEGWQRFRRAIREMMIASRSRKVGDPARVLANSSYIDRFVNSLSPEQKAAFGEANREFDKYADAMLDLYEEYGLKPEGWAAQTRERNPGYFPMDPISSDVAMAMQQLNPQKLASPGAKVMRAIGGSEYADGFVSMAAKVEAITRAGELNKALLPFFEEASANPLMEWCAKDITAELAKAEAQRRAGQGPTPADLAEHAMMLGDPNNNAQPWVEMYKSQIREAMRERRKLANDPDAAGRIEELDNEIRHKQAMLACANDNWCADPVNTIIDRLDIKVMEGIDPILTLWKNGEKRVYIVDPWVWDSIRGCQPQAYNLASEILRGFATISRDGTTTKNPFFGLLFNPAIDVVSAMIQHGLNPLGWRKGYVASLQGVDSELFRRAVRDNVLTGSKGSRDFIEQTWMFDPTNRSVIQKIGDRLAGNAGVRIFEPGPKWLDRLNAMAEPVTRRIEAAEQATRLAMYDQEYKRLIRKGLSEEDAGRRAAKKAADLMNFGEAGQIGRLASAIGVPFANVPSQVVRSGLRGFKANPMAFLMRAALMVTLPKMIEWAIYKDDPEYRAMPDYVKYGTLMVKVPVSDSSWYAKTFGTKWVALRLPPELGALFAGVPMQTLEATSGRKPAGDSLAQALSDVADTLTPPVTPTAVAAAGQLAMFKNTGMVTDLRFFDKRTFPTSDGKGGDRYKLTVQEVDTLFGSLGRLGVQSVGYFAGKEKHLPNPLQRFAPTPLRTKPKGTGIKLPKPPSGPKIKLPNL